MPPQDLHADRVEGAKPRHSLDNLANYFADALLHLARGLVGEGDGEDFRRPRPPEIEDVGDTRGQDAFFSGAGAGQDQHRPVQRLHRLALFGIEISKIRQAARPERARGNAARHRRGHWNGGMTLRLGHGVDDSFTAKMAFACRNWEGRGVPSSATSHRFSAIFRKKMAIEGEY